MYYFARQIAAGEKFPRLAFGFKPFDPTILKHHLPVPKCVKLTVEGSVYSVVICFDFSHGDSLRSCAEVFATTMPRADVNEAADKEMTPEGGILWGQHLAGRRGGARQRQL
jgi:hypothetical protein